MTGSPSVLVAGIGNIFLGDDGFGSEVVRRLAAQPWPDGVRVVDYGIGGVHLAYDLLEDCDLLVLVDAATQGSEPGSVYLVEVDPAVPAAGLDAHRMDPSSVFASLEALGGTAPRTLLVGCEPETVTDGIGLSERVSGAVDAAATAVRAVVRAALDGADPVAAPLAVHGGGN